VSGKEQEDTSHEKQGAGMTGLKCGSDSEQNCTAAQNQLSLTILLFISWK
jgi:hypothetical protein